MQFKHVLGPESLKTSKVGGPEPSSSYGIAGDPTGPGSQNFFVAPGHEHTRQCSGRTAHLSIHPDTPLGSACAPPLGACFLRLFPAILHWPQRYLTEAVHLRSWESRRSPSVHSQEEACSLAHKNVARGGSLRLPVVPLSGPPFWHPGLEIYM